MSRNVETIPHHISKAVHRMSDVVFENLFFLMHSFRALFGNLNFAESQTAAKHDVPVKDRWAKSHELLLMGAHLDDLNDETRAFIEKALCHIDEESTKDSSLIEPFPFES